jgi:hypothetical protein
MNHPTAPHANVDLAEGDELRRLVAEIEEALLSTRRKVTRALRLSLDQPEQRERLREIDARIATRTRPRW